MPFIKVGESLELVFGTGDIEVMPGLLADQAEAIAVLCFMRKPTPTPIGTHIDYSPHKYFEIEETPVRLVFTKIESLDVVIKSLNEAREYMVNGKLDEPLPTGHQSTESA